MTSSTYSNHFIFLQGDLIYVNYGRVEDFMELINEHGVDPRGKIAIVRYGQIFRGDKVRIHSDNYTDKFKSQRDISNIS